jgi:ornithine carbamoyltransferase
MKKDILTIKDLEKDEIEWLILKGLELKKMGRNPDYRPLLGYVLGLLFDKASTRTRVSFEVAMMRLGGNTIFMSSKETQLSRNETVEDTARVLSRYLDCLAIRTYSQQMVETMAKYADIPVINALTDMYHPCQVLSDIMTVKEKKGRIEGLKIVWLGDGNNVANSWINLARKMDFELVIACPRGYEPLELKDRTDNIKLVREPKDAVKDADIINTDVWVSMGQEDKAETKRKDFTGYQLNKELLSYAKPDAIVMHCLPAHRGEEITDEVLDGPNSVVFDQAENKLYMHEAILEMLLLEKAK